MEIRKGLICEIYESKDLGNCSNNGISARHKDVLVIMDEKDAQVFKETSERPTVKIVRRIISGKAYLHAEPVNGTEKGMIGFMAGGSFIFSCDGRFSKYVNQYPVALHDRQETPEEYDMLSR